MVERSPVPAGRRERTTASQAQGQRSPATVNRAGAARLELVAWLVDADLRVGRMDRARETGRRLGPDASELASALSRRFPRIAPLLYLLAAGCGLSRLMAQAHYLSDVVAGAVGGTLVGLADWARTRRR